MSQILNFIYIILSLYLSFIGLNILLSWFPGIYEFKFFRICKKVSDWYLGPFHGVLVFGPIDLTPII